MRLQGAENGPFHGAILEQFKIALNWTCDDFKGRELAKHVWSAAGLQEESVDEKQSAKMYPASSGDWSPGA